MITHIKMKNFKSWKDSGKVELAPLTGFFGTNSSGKSSLLQMLLLLKQTAERSNVEEVIFFGDESSYVNLGNFREVIHGHSEKALITLLFGIGCNLNFPPYEVLKDKDGKVIIDGFDFSTCLIEIQHGTIVEEFDYVSLDKQAKILWMNDLLELNGRQLDDYVPIKNCYGVAQNVPNLLHKFSEAFESLFSQVYYLGPVRSLPQRYYHWNNRHPIDLGMWGNKVIHALLSARLRNLKTFHDKDALTIEKRISTWLRQMELGYSFHLGPSGALKDNNYEIRIQKSVNSPRVTLVDMGYGLADFLPVLVYCYYVPEGSTLILEQPGVHLHPMAQAQLADLLIEVVNERKLQILVESHSEHLLNRLQRRIAEEKISVDKTALYFCRNDEGVSNIEHLKMDEFGNISNWPENFFGDEMGDLFAMTEAQRERQKKAEG
jgi:predicted ATPase